MAQRGNPLFNLRLTPEAHKTVRQVARIYGASSASGFVREMIESMCSGDAERVHAFNCRLFQKMGERLQMEFGLEVTAKPIRPKRKGGRRAKS